MFFTFVREESGGGWQRGARWLPLRNGLLCKLSKALDSFPFHLDKYKLHLAEFSLKRRGEQSLLTLSTCQRPLPLVHRAGLLTLTFRDQHVGYSDSNIWIVSMDCSGFG